MAQPTQKARGIEIILAMLAGGVSREDTIRSNKCMPAPIGCGGEATGFRDTVSKREYSNSGLCQQCQDSFFGASEDEE